MDKDINALRLNKLASDSETAKSWYDRILSRPEEESIEDDLLEVIKVRGPDFKIPRVIINQMESEYKDRDYTLPGYKYVGPGTKTASNILKKVRASNKLDEIALHHDLDQYITRTDKDVKLSDDDAIKLSQYSTNYSDYPLAKIALENALGRGFGPKPDPKPEVFEYLDTLHNYDEAMMDDEIHQNHAPTTLSKEYYSDQYEMHYNIPKRQDYIPPIKDKEFIGVKELGYVSDDQFLKPDPPDNLSSSQYPGTDQIHELYINKKISNGYGIPEEEAILYTIPEEEKDYDDHDFDDDIDYERDDWFAGTKINEFYINEDL